MATSMAQTARIFIFRLTQPGKFIGSHRAVTLPDLGCRRPLQGWRKGGVSSSGFCPVVTAFSNSIDGSESNEPIRVLLSLRRQGRGDSVVPCGTRFFSLTFPGTNVPGFHILPLRGWRAVGSTSGSHPRLAFQFSLDPISIN